MRTFLSLIAVVVALNAQISKNSYIQSFFDNGGEINQNIKNLLDNDEFFKQANDYLTNQDDMSKKEIDVSDPEVKGDKKMRTKYFPNWHKAMPLFIKSVEVYDNPISAYQALYIYNTVYGRNKNVKAFGNMSEVLYKKEKKMCESYLYYGETLTKGYGRKSNFEEALKIYKEAQDVEKCTTGWIKNVIASKILYLENKLK
ncbi:MAG: hypothetical protein ACPGUI_00410 [Halarcobacter sp.]